MNASSTTLLILQPTINCYVHGYNPNVFIIRRFLMVKTKLVGGQTHQSKCRALRSLRNRMTNLHGKTFWLAMFTILEIGMLMDAW